MKTAAILVVYSEAFAETAIHLFVDMVRRIDPDGVVVVVTNNHRLQVKAREGVTVLQGTNVLHEFGAWQTGLDHVRSLPGGDALQAVVFANDTYCHYRSMGALEQTAFVRSTKAAMRDRGPVACGELARSPGRKIYDFDGVKTRQWIATYFFTINRAALEAIGWAMHPSMQAVIRWVPGGLDEEAFFAAEMDPLLKRHFQAWLFGRKGLAGWRRCAPLSPDNRAMMEGKAHMLVCEQDLMMRLLVKGTKVRSVFHSPVIFLARQIFARL